MVESIAKNRKTSLRAKIIPPLDQHRFIAHVMSKRHGQRNQVIALLSFKAGLRACEIAGLDWTMICDASGRVTDSIEVSADIAKKSSARRLPCHPGLQAALEQLHAVQGHPVAGPICRSERGGAMTAGAVVNWFAQHYRALGFEGCSSHSGRRTMITMAARALAQVGGSLRDVQELAGHRALSTTERYIEGDRVVQRRLVGLL